MVNKNFPANFLWGTATASLQIEGGDKNNSWYDWCEANKIPNGDHCIVANDHWNRVEEDIDCMKQLNVNSYRLSIEWSRVQPSKNQWDEDAINHYRNEILALKEAGIQPMVTLHHFSNPTWFEEQEGWLSDDSVELFCVYTKYVVEHLGDLVKLWVTINEPNVYLTMGYVLGIFPPGQKDNLRAYFKGAKNMIKAHCKSYKIIHQIRKEKDLADTKVGAALHLRIFDKAKPGLLSNISQKLCYFLFQDLFFNGMYKGKWFGRTLAKGVFFDFLGINYYTRDILKANWKAFPIFADLSKPEHCEVNDLDWEIYPEGLSRVIKRYYKKCMLPIYITENGIADAQDLQREKYIKDHLIELCKSIEGGIPVLGYYHWTLMDNFEWMEGYDARFGLFKHDVHSQKRTLRKSGEYYAQVCKTGNL